MKSEHRHHLAENDLEHRLGDLALKLKPYANHILFGLLGIAVVAVIAVVLFQKVGASEKNAWAAYTGCETGNANQYIEAAQEYPDSTMAQWAWVNAGEILLRNGVELSFSSRTVAVSDLEKARKAFDAVLNNSSAEPEARERALNGLARTLEALSDGDTQPAIDAYTELINDFPDSRFRQWAEYRVEELNSPAVQEFYAWYHAQNPAPADRPLPQDDPHAGLPGFNIPSLDPTMDGPDLPAGLDLNDLIGPADTDVDAVGTETEGDQPADPPTDEAGETTEGPDLGPPADSDAATEGTEPTGDAADAVATPTETEPTETPESAETPAADSATETPAAPDEPTTEPATDDEASTENADPS